MLEVKHPQDLARLRHLALTAQGLLQVQPYGRFSMNFPIWIRLVLGCQPG